MCVDAFSLFQKGTFANRMPGGPVEAIVLDVKPGGDSCAPAGEGKGVPFPAFLHSNEPAPEVVRSILDNHANGRTWATFAFRAMAGFDLQVLPFHVPAPMGAKECDASGRLLQSDGKPQDNAMPKSRDGGIADSRTFPPPVPSRPSPQPRPQSSAMSKLSFAANVALAILCAFLFVSRKQTGKQPVPSPGEAASAARVEELVQAKTDVARLSAANAELSGRIAEVEARNRELALEIDRAKAETAEATDRFLESLPDYFTEEQCAKLPFWGLQENGHELLYHSLNQWLNFFENHSKTNNQK